MNSLTIIPETFKSLKENLDFDDNFHQALSSTSNYAYLRLWECSTYGIVLGRSNNENIETHFTKVEQDNVCIIKRSSGGGTVLLGPGCLCYSIFLPLSYHPRLRLISESNVFIMESIKNALSCLNSNIELKGHTDLCLNNKKFSGNAQRRTRDSILFHGTILYDFDLNLISKYLAHPSKEPDYRSNRDHRSFLTNLNATNLEITAALEKNLSFF